MQSAVFTLRYPHLAIAGSDERFPVHRIYCVGQNYAAHAREMGNDPEREAPVWFTKVPDSVVPGGGRVVYPPGTSDLHHEVELVVALSAGGADLSPTAAHALIHAYAVGIDLTRRDLQAAAKKAGRPWDTAKSFEQAAPVSALHRAADIGHPASGRIWLSVNGESRQEGDIGDLIWPVAEALSALSRLFTLAPGDLLFTGTPSGVGPVVAGDRITCGIDGIDELQVDIVAPATG
ncbi:MAG TPA: fumarylacetoacetate hydrolase family protein [Woeseiaceae bacterium]|nr:fumarylacetoacetate hydrolase family protein [Woeseiaceae bacterium]